MILYAVFLKMYGVVIWLAVELHGTVLCGSYVAQSCVTVTQEETELTPPTSGPPHTTHHTSHLPVPMLTLFMPLLKILLVAKIFQNNLQLIRERTHHHSDHWQWEQSAGDRKIGETVGGGE